MIVSSPDLPGSFGFESKAGARQNLKIMRKTIDRLFGQPVAALALFIFALVCGWHGFDLALNAATGGPGPRDLIVTVNQRTTQYFFNYQDLGFIKRGLVGTLLHPFPALTTRLGLASVSGALLILFTVLFWRLFITSTASVAQQGRGVLALLCATMPGFFLRLGWDFGRFDVLDLIAALASFALIERSWWFLASIPAGFAILAHEDFALFALPLMVALARPGVSTQSGGGRAWAWAKLLAVPGAATGAVAVWGRSHWDFAALVHYFAANTAYVAAAPGGQVNLDEVAVLTRTLRDNFALDAQMFVAKRAAFHLPIILVWFWFVWKYASNFYQRNNLRKDLAFGAALAPLLLGIIGFDYYRWVAMAAVNLILVIVLQCRRLAKAGIVPVIGWDLNAKVLVASAIFGPICNTKSFLYPFLLLDRIWPGKIPW